MEQGSGKVTSGLRSNQKGKLLLLSGGGVMLRPLGGGSGHGVQRNDKEMNSMPRVDEERA